MLENSSIKLSSRMATRSMSRAKAVVGHHGGDGGKQADGGGNQASAMPGATVASVACCAGQPGEGVHDAPDRAEQSDVKARPGRPKARKDRLTSIASISRW